ncbi:MAG: alanine racemase [Desulfatirhabdiaceae bacterium]
MQSIWAEIDLSAISHNINAIRSAVSSKSLLMAVVKANAYGHGAVEVARTAIQSGADMLGVARIDEAVQLRQAGIEAPILIFGSTPADRVDQLVALNLTQTVFSFQQAEMLSQALSPASEKLKVHIKVDTGMGRLGVLATGIKLSSLGKFMGAHFLREIESIVNLPGLDSEGIFTHFAGADNPDKTSAGVQLSLFLELIDHLKRMGHEFRLCHAANSAAALEMLESHLDMVRPGIAMYGCYPVTKPLSNSIELKPALTLKTRIIQIKKVPRDFPVSYGHTWRTSSTTRIATVSAGYADGVNRLLSSRGFMLVNGEKAPIVGRICMDLTMLDIGNLPDARVDDEVVVMGSQKNASITADDIASLINTISYEVLTSVSARVPRIYRESASGVMC